MKDLDLELYNKYMNGEKDAFETLYNKYKNKIQYFIFNIVKNYEKAEDITQEVFIYILQNKVRENCSFKYYIYLVARSRAYNYINQEKRRTEINEKYSLLDSEEIQKDVSDLIEKQERENDDFVIFMKEKDKSMPYFALKVDNLDILVKENEN